MIFCGRNRAFASSLFIAFLFASTFLLSVNGVRSERHQLNAITELDKFINAPDASYEYEVTSTTETDEYTFFDIQMTSQEYLPEVTNHPLWKHKIHIVVPKSLGISNRAVFVGQGPKKNDDLEPLQVQFALSTKAVVVCQYEIPNEPLRIKLENGTWTEPQHEDHLVAAFWYKFTYEKQDPKYMIHWAMAKAVIRGMDTVQSVLGNDVKIQEFVLAGFSKRGWLTYFTAAADKRVSGIVPAVIDVLNFEQAVRRIHGALCAWPTALLPYVEWKFTDAIGTPEFSQLAQLVDPLSYNPRLRHTDIFIVSASSDQFFLTATENVGYNQLLAKNKYFVEEINGGHQYYNIVPQLQVLLYNLSVPEIHWTRDEKSNGDVIIQVNILAPDTNTANVKGEDVFAKPEKVVLWTAYNPKERDFRLPTLPTDPMPPSFEPSEPLKPVYTAGGFRRYEATVSYQQGFTAYNVEITYKNPFDSEKLPPLKFNTNSFVDPSKPPCRG